ncbi:MAG: alpha/beta hydrolase-fold protein [Caulobacteraceae bacterium]
MNPLKSVLCAALMALTASVAFAQPGPARAPGAAPRPAAIRNMEVTPERRMIARLRAPDAQLVKLRSDYSPELSAGVPMTKGADGVWSYTTEVLEPGVWGYGFVVDGVNTPDQQNPDRDLGIPGSGLNFIDVATDTMAWVKRGPVPHGVVGIVNYESKAMGGMARRMHIYTPPGYELPANGGKRYPVLYLFHGFTGDDASWTGGGRIAAIMDNMIAEGRAKPMIVVMPADTLRPGPTWVSPNVAGPVLKTSAIAQDMFGDVIPYVESHYRAIANPDNRAIAGLSAGGLVALDLGFGRQDAFRYLGSFSSGWFNDAAEVYDKANPQAFGPETRKRLRVLWFGAGTTDIAQPNTEALLKVLDRKCVKYTYWLTDRGHNWVNWRRYLNAFAPLLFR